MSAIITESLGKRIKKYYSEYDEWQRLIKDPYHQIEFITTIHFLKKYLPKKGHILDAGGGSGRYTIELARNGYNVTLIDFTPALLKVAKIQIKKAGVEENVIQISEASITDLSEFDDGSFDAVLCSGGPLSHILDRVDRQKAASELVRVAKTGAPVFVSVLSRFGVLTSELINFQDEIGRPLFRRIRDTGDYPGNPKFNKFTVCHYFTPEELKRLFERKIKIAEMAALEGLASWHPNEVNGLYKNKKGWKIWIETHLRTCNQPSIMGGSEHILLVGMKQFNR